MIFDDYVRLAERRRMLNRHERRGQAYFNALEDVDPGLADLARGTARDPFYDDTILDAFLQWVAGNWQEMVVTDPDL